MNPVAALEPMRALSQAQTAAIRQALLGPGLLLDVGLAMLRVQGDAPALAQQLQAVYRHFPFSVAPGWADVHLHIQRRRGLRRWLRPQVVFRCDSDEPFDPFPADTALPLMEWGANYLIGRRFNDSLLFHAGVVERDGHALLMPALPGSGKSTLTAALSLRGWRMLSDEFGALDLQRGSFRPVLKPVALKNTSIDVIRAFAPEAELGPEFPRTRKGRVAHLAPSGPAVAARHTHAWPGAVLLPRWRPSGGTRLEPVPPQLVFPTLAFNAFNYAVLGAEGFRAAVSLAQACPTWQLEYSDLHDAINHLEREWPAVVLQATARRAGESRHEEAMP